MARIKAFNGLRYNKDKVDYSAVVTQPYDKISQELRDKYYERSPYSAVRLILSKAQDPYLDAQKNLHDWLQGKIILQDKEPSIYAYHQEYQTDGIKKVRRGFIAGVGLEYTNKKIILPHEKTLSKPKADRLNLLKATKTHFGQIFLLYKDTEKKIYSLLAPFTAQEPDETVVDDFQDTHKLWKISDPATIANIAAIMRDKQLLIADGHHRYATSCTFAEENGVKPGEEGAFGYTMATLINMDDEGLTVLPTHRMVHGLAHFSSAEFLKNCQTYFDVKPTPDLDQTLKAIEQHRTDNIFGFYDGKQFCTLTLKSLATMDELIGTAQSKEWKSLDVAVLHTVIMEKLLGISKEKQDAQENISYIRTAYSAYNQVKSGKEQAVFFMNYTSVQEVYAVAQNGEVMPQKSTDFYPKLLSGMVMYNIK
jgi:uncharacterized protein (DUF1015 family)